MMPIPTGEKFVQYPCLGDTNDEPYRLAGGLTGKKIWLQRGDRWRAGFELPVPPELQALRLETCANWGRRWVNG
jgi:hypothetical protein